MIKKPFQNFRRSLLVVCIAGITTIGCSSLPILKNNTETQVGIPSLGNVGESYGAFTKTYTTTSIPEYDQPIKLSVTKLPFTKKTYQKYSTEQKKRSLPFTVGYTDFIPEKPSYVHLAITDKVTVIDALNSEVNLGVKNYLKNNIKSCLVTGVSVAFSAEDVLAISGADDVFWTKNGTKTYTLQLYTDNKPTKAISLTKGAVFDFTTADFCWKEDYRHLPAIVDITTGKCPKKSYMDPSKTKQKKDYLKL